MGHRVRSLVIVAGAVVLVAGIAAGAFAFSGGDGEDTPASTEAAAGDDGSTTWPAEGGDSGDLPAGEDMATIDAGTYTLGIETPDLAESPLQETQVDSFFIDIHEVTNAEYQQFASSVSAPAPAGWRGQRAPAGEEQHPVQGVPVAWAEAYCAAVGKRLPTEAEWEIAARGPEGLLYPWGDQEGAIELPAQGTYPVGSVPANRSAFGVFDLAGNAWEWVGESYDPNKLEEGERVLRGGQNGWLRRNVNRLTVDPAQATAVSVAGFRCAADAVDVYGTPGEFREVDLPADAATPTSTTLPPGVLISDDFDDPTTGWFEDAGPQTKYGYHPNEYFHLETRSPNQQVVALAPSGFGPETPISVRTEVFVEPNNTNPDGSYEYGLVLRASGDGSSFLAFTVDPVNGHWSVWTRRGGARQQVDTKPFRVPEVVTLQVDASGDDFAFKIGQATVTTRTIPNLGESGTGLVVQSGGTNTRSHIHFETFQILELDSAN